MLNLTETLFCYFDCVNSGILTKFMKVIGIPEL